MKIRKVNLRLEFFDIDGNISYGMSSVYDERNAFLLEERHQSLNRKDDGRHRENMIKDGDFDLTRIAINELLDFQLNLLLTLEVFSSEIQLSHNRSTINRVRLYRSFTTRQVFLTEA